MVKWSETEATLKVVVSHAFWVALPVAQLGREARAQSTSHSPLGTDAPRIRAVPTIPLARLVHAGLVAHTVAQEAVHAVARTLAHDEVTTLRVATGAAGVNTRAP